MARYQGLGVEIKSLQGKMKPALESGGYRVERELGGETSFLIECKEGGRGSKEVVSVKGTPDDFVVSGIREDDQKIWSIVEDTILESATNPQAFRNHKEQAAVASPAGSVQAPGTQQVASPSPASTNYQSIAPTRPPVPTVCQNCGAPLNPGPDDVVLVCRYCGTTISLLGESVRHSMLPAMISGDQAMKTVQDYASSSLLVTKGMVQSGDWGYIKLCYVPVWSIPIQLTGTIYAERALVESKSGAVKVGQKIGVKVVSGILGRYGLGGIGKEVEGALKSSDSISETMDVPVIARRAAMFQPDPGKYHLPIEKKESFHLTGDEILNAEFMYSEAAERAKSLAFEKLKARYLSIYSFNVTASTGEGELIYSPFWFVKYTMTHTEHVVVVDGLTGAVVAGQRPWVPI